MRWIVWAALATAGLADLASSLFWPDALLAVVLSGLALVAAVGLGAGLISGSE